MVEENEIRAGVSFYERARVAAEAARLGLFGTPAEAISHLFAQASPAKRSKIGSFVVLYQALGADLRFPAAIAGGSRKSGGEESTDVFVATLAADGGRVTAGAYLGGSRDERAGDIAVLRDGRVAVTGSTGSTDFPVSGEAFQPELKGRADAFLTYYRSGAREISTYFGGSGPDQGKQLERDRDGALVMIGSTESRDFPTAAGPQIRWKRSLGFVARFPVPGARPEISSYLVGTADELAVGADNAIYVGGVTASSSPIFGGSVAPGCEGSLLRKILPTGRLAFSGFVRGLGAIDVDRAGAVYSAGTDVTGALRTTQGVFAAIGRKLPDGKSRQNDRDRDADGGR